MADESRTQVGANDPMLYEATKNWNKDKIDELKKIHADLTKFKAIDDKNSIVDDKKLKKRIAKIMLDIVKDTGNTMEEIESNSYIISTFTEYTFNDELDEVTTIAIKLETPERILPDDILKEWNRMKNILEDYLKK